MLLLAAIAAITLAATGATYAAGRGRGTTGTLRLGIAGLVRAFLIEATATLAVLAALPWRLRPTVPRGASRGVVLLVPEIGCSSGGFLCLARRLRAGGWTVRAAVEYPSPRTTDALDRALGAQLDVVPAGSEVVILGHGIGGVLATHHAAQTTTRIRRVITLGAPHQGSRGLIYRLCPSPGSSSATEGADVTAIYSDFDAWLVPIDNAYCPQAFNIAVSGVGHCTMLWSRRIADLVIENLTATPPPRR